MESDLYWSWERCSFEYLGGLWYDVRHAGLCLPIPSRSQIQPLHKQHPTQKKKRKTIKYNTTKFIITIIKIHSSFPFAIFVCPTLKKKMYMYNCATYLHIVPVLHRATHRTTLKIPCRIRFHSLTTISLSTLHYPSEYDCSCEQTWPSPLLFSDHATYRAQSIYVAWTD